jgi:S-formylglutathione hydrolase FrmB
MKSFKFVNLLVFTLVFFTTKAATVDTIKVYSCLMQKDIKVVIIKPNSYKKKKSKFPTTYLLHGWSGNYSNWITKVPKIKNLADLHQMLIVCPDGGFDSWYLDSPINQYSQYESFLKSELVHHIDINYKTIDSANARAITGLSMGGRGALYVGFKSASVFGAIGSMSGALEIPMIKDKRYGIEKYLGDSTHYNSTWLTSSLYKMLDTLPLTNQKVIFDCGTEDFCVIFNDQLHSQLRKRKIPHEYIARPGNHSWPYWSYAIEYQLQFFSNYFSKKENGL